MTNAPAPTSNALRSVCVYCGSSPGIDPDHVEAARALGTQMGRAGVKLVYGGGSNGLMGAVARATLDAGGQVLGIIPEFLKNKERMMADAQELIVVPDMHTRKRMMFERADAFVALPGGIGTLEELVEQLTWAQLGQHRKPIVIANLGGFWSPLRDLLDHMRQAGFIHAANRIDYIVTERVDDILPRLREAVSADGRQPLRPEL
ncbi:MAG: TIGR00730 family Rossman fold protein [Rhodoblastus sp.]|nr:MAG: TIGR00730 family Rossman fold protein [Rhodoblastus sp.]